MTNRATYAYCVMRSATRPAAARVPPGVPGGGRPEVAPVARGHWIALAEVPLDRYGSGALEASLRDLQWVGDVALAHEAVVEHFTRKRGVTVIPMQLFTMFSTPERAIAAIRRRSGALARTFRHVAGCEEWGVRVMRGRSVPAVGAPRPGSGGTGTAFLARRRRARDDAAAAARAAADAAQIAFESLASIARDGRRRDGRGGSDPAPLLEAAFLVPAAERAIFKAEARRLAKQVARAGGRMTLTGPWPPYHFVGAGAGR